MGQDALKFPKVDVGEHQDELILRDFTMFNYHINSHKMRFLKDVIDIVDAHRLVDDFDDLDLDDDWTNTLVGVGTVALTDMMNGVVLLTNAAAEDDANEIAKVAEAFKLVDNYPLYAEIRFKLDDAIESDFWFGLVTGVTHFTQPDDEVVFASVDGDASINFITRTNAAQTLTDTGIDLSDTTWLRLGFHWDGQGNVRYFVIQDGDAPQTILAAGVHTTHICQDEELAVGFGIMNGEAVAKNLWVDYYKVVQKRGIE